jgi:phospholipase C
MGKECPQGARVAREHPVDVMTRRQFFAKAAAATSAGAWMSHYFGTLSSTLGFNDPSPAFQQKGWNPQTQNLDPAGITLPCRFGTTRGPLLDGECVNDPDLDFPTVCRFRRRCPVRKPPVRGIPSGPC